MQEGHKCHLRPSCDNRIFKCQCKTVARMKERKIKIKKRRKKERKERERTKKERRKKERKKEEINDKNKT